MGGGLGMIEFSTYPSRSVSVLSRSNSRESYTLSQVLGLEPMPSECDSSGSEETYHDVVDHDSISTSQSDSNMAASAQDQKEKKVKLNLKRSLSMKNLSVKGLGTRVLHALTFPKRMRQKAAEKKRFNIYSISVETREQLKQIYVY